MLFRKAYRAMWVHKKSYIACVFLMMLGTMMLTAMGTAVTGMGVARDSFYDGYSLAHVWANVVSVPVSEVDRLRGLPGVLDVNHRTTLEMRAEVEGSDDIITLRVLSFVPGEDGRVNDFQLAGIEPALQNDIMLNMMFKNTREFEAGDSITLFSQGRAFDFEITGSFLSPEFVYIARGGTDMLPDHMNFGIAYITEEAMNNLTGRTGLANQVLFTLMEGYAFEDVRGAIQDALQPYGLVSLLERDDLLSYAFLDMQLTSMESVVTALPLTFVIIAVVVLYMMLKRIIEQERTQIGTLKAFGYSNASLCLHYMAYGGITGLAGGLLGFLYGAAMSGFYLQMFLDFFTMPAMVQPVNPMFLLASVGVGLGGGLLGAFMGALRAIRLSPAEAMRPEAPKPIKFDIVGKITVLRYILTSRGQMALRGIIRNPVRSFSIVMGVTFSFMLLVVYGDMEGMIDTLLYGQFENIRVYNVRVNLTEPIPHAHAVESATAVRHISRAEALWEVPVTLVNRNLRDGTVITGIAKDGELFRVFDSDSGITYVPPTDGLIITNGVADQLQAQAGDILYISTHLAEDDIPIPVSRVITQNVGAGAFIELATLSALIGHPPVATSIIFTSDNIPYATDFFKESPIAASVDSTDATLQQYMDMMEPFSAIYSVMFVMGVAIAFAIIYNTSTISLSERKREFATLRVLGLTVDEVCEIMRFEYWVLAAIGMGIGVPSSRAMLVSINTMIGSDLMSMPTTLSASAYVNAVLGCVVAIVLSNFFAKKKIAKFDMVEVLKERE